MTTFITQIYKDIQVQCPELLFRIHLQTPNLYDISTKMEMSKNGRYGKWITLKYTSNMSTYSWVLKWDLLGCTVPLIAESYYIYDFISKVVLDVERIRDWKEVFIYKPERDGVKVLRNNGVGKRHPDFKMWFDSPVYLPDKSVCCLVRYSRSKKDDIVFDEESYDREKVASITYSLFWIRNECDYEVLREHSFSSGQYNGYEEVVSQGFKELASNYLELIKIATEETEDIPLESRMGCKDLSYVEDVDYLMCEYNPFLYEREKTNVKFRF